MKAVGSPERIHLTRRIRLIRTGAVRSNTAVLSDSTNNLWSPTCISSSPRRLHPTLTATVLPALSASRLGPTQYRYSCMSSLYTASPGRALSPLLHGCHRFRTSLALWMTGVRHRGSLAIRFFTPSSSDGHASAQGLAQ